MDIKKKTAIFTIGSIVLFFAAWIIYDIYAITEGGTEASISFMMYEWSYKYPIFTFACGFIPGVLVGHFFWKISDTPGTRRITEFVKGKAEE